MKPLLLAALAVFVVQNQCGVPGVSHEDLAVHFLDQGQFERALREAGRARREHPGDTRPRVLAALAHAGLGADEAAALALEQALRIDPDDPRLYATLRTLCAQADREGLALHILQRLAAEGPDHWLLNLNLGWAHRAVGDTARARQLLEASVANADSSAPMSERIVAHLELARLYLDQDRAADAARVLDAGVALDPREARLLIMAGETYLRLGDGDAAAPLFEDALHVADDVAATASAIAMIYYEAGAPLQAIDYYERAVDLRPTPPVLNNLAWTYAEADLELERAQALALRAVKAEGDNVVYLDTYAEVLFRRGRRARAVALIRRCLELEPPDGEHAAYLQGQLDRFTEVAAAPP